MAEPRTTIVIPNLNGADSIADCLDSLSAQSLKAQIVVVDNGSLDSSVNLIESKYPDVTLLKQPRNLGFAGGVNIGIRLALENGSKYVALFNNDATADSHWLEHLVKALEDDKKIGAATGKFVDQQKKHLDSTGDFYTTWGLPYPRGRGEPVSDKYDKDTNIFAASGGASVYRLDMLKEIGLFDEDFFAYYEDVDLSFRAQLAGWQIRYVPEALAYHQIGATSSKIKGFTTYQTIKNLPWLLWKNVPARLLPKILPRFTVVYLAFLIRGTLRGQIWPVIRGFVVSFILLPKKLVQRRGVQKNRKVSVDYINNMLVHDLPPNATKLRSLRARL